ncbi:22884_t:CDS:1, partial [Entrophospora sp. SA101]
LKELRMMMSNRNDDDVNKINSINKKINGHNNYDYDYNNYLLEYQ